ncbi:hypothetical protein EJV46_02655 [Roseococcus sp. SYP-B2431]|uniref:hypothetical protein n=1 Tax=Roseococcus sp. SYP-B2431 TaxID=2496640 RepID=UPI00103F8E04|nr:hypothetical protein [Roseococcus sp. SYP-B2431]TCH99592.1 hypothetical protein EJV46_02655 [Roseococcus sp. SYP-B2431]
MPDASPDAALFAALLASRPSPATPPPDGTAELVLRLADSIRHGSALLREAAAELAGGRGIARLPDLLAQAELASLEQAACARGLLEVLPRPGERRAA